MSSGPESKTSRQIRDDLTRTNWSFTGSGTQRLSIHGLHWFPGNFIPQIPSFLVQILTRPADVVLDPFVGSGTTACEAAAIGRVALGCDVNPAALQVAAAKLSILAHFQEIAKAVRAAIGILSFPHLIQVDSCSDPGIGAAPDLTAWFSARTLRSLRGVWEFVVRSTPVVARPAFEVLFTDTLFACASTRQSTTRSGRVRHHHWGWIADNVTPSTLQDVDVVELYVARLGRLLAVCEALSDKTIAPAHVVRADARLLPLSEGSVDAIVMSPPYLGMIDYTSASRLTYLWYGWSMAKDRILEIGARYTRNRKSVQHDYAISMAATADECYRVMKIGGYCAIVVGSSRRFPSAKDDVLRVFGERLECFWGPVVRTPTRRRLAEKAGREVQELICVFRKGS